MRNYCILPLLIAVVGLAAPRAGWALGTEEFGNGPLAEANYKEWPGLAEVANNKCRVYQSWVNGNEDFYFAGDTDQLNEALKQFAAIEVKTHEVLIRPGPGKAHSFNRERTLDCNWHVNVHGGISKFLTTRDKADKVWPADPIMTIWTGGNIDLAKIKIPDGVTVLGVREKSARIREALDSKDSTVRGWGSSGLADLDPYNAENYAAVEKLLKDEENWVRICAAGTISQFGKRAEKALPQLRELSRSDDEQLKRTAAEAIRAVESAEEDAQRAKDFDAEVKRIGEFRQQERRKSCL